jgi:hypothetical protein
MPVGPEQDRSAHRLAARREQQRHRHQRQSQQPANQRHWPGVEEGARGGQLRLKGLEEGQAEDGVHDLLELQTPRVLLRHG